MEDIKRPKPNMQPNQAPQSAPTSIAQNAAPNNNSQSNNPTDITGFASVQTQTQDPQQEQSAPKIPKQGKPKNKGVIIAIVASIILAILLIGVAVWVYMQSQNTTEDPVTTTTTEEVVEDDGRVDAEDVDATIETVEKEINSLDDSGDFGQNDLTNSEIGL
jgi:uncharacterized protein HemX